MTQPQNESSSDESILKPLDSNVLQSLLDNQKKFLSFLEKRVGSRQLAEEILQDAYVKTIEKGSALREDEGAVAWFYRLLRNAAVDSYRRKSSKEKALGFKSEQDKLLTENLDPEFENAICGCMKTLLPGLKDEYADILNQVDLEEKEISAVAKEQGISLNNANVRLHRARLALKRQLERSCGACATHGCLDCSCKKSQL